MYLMGVNLYVVVAPSQVLLARPEVFQQINNIAIYVNRSQLTPSMLHLKLAILKGIESV